MRTFQCLLFVLKQSYKCYYIKWMTLPLRALTGGLFFSLWSSDNHLKYYDCATTITRKN